MPIHNSPTVFLRYRAAMLGGALLLAAGLAWAQTTDQITTNQNTNTGSGSNSQSTFGSSRFGSSSFGNSSFGSSSHFGSSTNSRSGTSSSDQSRSESSRSGRNSRKNKKTGQQDQQAGQGTRSMGKGNVATRRGGLGAAGGGGGAPSIELPQIKIDPKVLKDTLFFAPTFINAAPGDRFIITLAYFNSERHRLDSLDIWVRYPPDLMKPVWADTAKLKDFAKGPIEARIWPGQGTIHIGAKLAQSPKGSTVELADLHWQALSPALGARIELAAPQGQEVAVREAGVNLVAGDNQHNPQKVGVGVNIIPLAWDEPVMRTVEQVNEMVKPAPLDKSGRLRLAILSPKTQVATGEMATADIALVNPSRLAFDDLKLRIRYNPDAVTILDADEDNYIGDGLNIYDGRFHGKFPFDGHLQNLVDPESGTIEYHMGSVMGPRVYPTGVFARIVYRMKRDAGMAAFWFEVEDPDLRVRVTDVTAYGRSLLGEQAATAEDALHGVEVAVKPMDLKPAVTKGKDLAKTAALTPTR